VRLLDCQKLRRSHSLRRATGRAGRKWLRIPNGRKDATRSKLRESGSTSHAPNEGIMTSPLTRLHCLGSSLNAIDLPLPSTLSILNGSCRVRMHGKGLRYNSVRLMKVL
jgi:hypothetical protein